ncbi:UNVERIFIED_CONTAM: arginine--tRNA ligase [Campylobacter lari]
MNKIELKNKLLITLKEIAKELNIEKEILLIEPKGHADLTTNMAMGNKGQNPIELANKIITKINKDDFGLASVEIAGPGFINFNIANDSFVDAVNEILLKGKDYGRGHNKGKLNIEFVSANPTGFLHVGHARNAAIGSTVANIVEFSGIDVTREYYINDAGNQINVLANSVFSRYQQIFDPSYPMPEECYKGEDILFAAKEFTLKYGDKFKNVILDGDVLELFKKESVEIFLRVIKETLKDFGV